MSRDLVVVTAAGIDRCVKVDIHLAIKQPGVPLPAVSVDIGNDIRLQLDPLWVNRDVLKGLYASE